MKEIPEECECCNFKGAELKAYTQMDNTLWLCLLCASTQASSALRYPDQFPQGTRYVLAATSYCANTILAAIENARISIKYPNIHKGMEE